MSRYATLLLVIEIFVSVEAVSHFAVFDALCPARLVPLGEQFRRLSLELTGLMEILRFQFKFHGGGNPFSGPYLLRPVQPFREAHQQYSVGIVVSERNEKRSALPFPGAWALAELDYARVQAPWDFNRLFPLVQQSNICLHRAAFCRLLFTYPSQFHDDRSRLVNLRKDDPVCNDPWRELLATLDAR